MSIFKSYDIRGIYGEEWNKEDAYKIGYFLPSLIQAEQIVIGQDARASSGEVFFSLSRGLMDAGCNVTDIGLCSTPALYFATAYFKFDGSVMITASHNPPEYNGMKISRSGAVPVGYDSGLKELEEMVSGTINPSNNPGTLKTLDIRDAYLNHLAPYKEGIRGIKAVADCSDGMASVFIHDVIKNLRAEVITFYDTPDGSFPHHPPNPLEEKNLADLKARTIEEKADLGICFDGDADRVMFIDEKGSFVSPDLITALLGLYYFRYSTKPVNQKKVIYDVRSSRSVVEYIRELGGTPIMCKVGHSHAKKLLREENCLFGGELAGHYYFSDNFYCDSGMIAALLVLSTLSSLAADGVSFSQIIEQINRYFFSGEINFIVKDKDRIIDRISTEYMEYTEYMDGKLTDIDGIRIDFPTWWFSLRKSNTEPYLRLVVEAETAEDCTRKTDELKQKIKDFDTP